MPNYGPNRGRGPRPRASALNHTANVDLPCTPAEKVQLRAQAIAANKWSVADYLRALAGWPEVRNRRTLPPPDPPAHELV